MCVSKYRRNILTPFLRPASQQLFSKQKKSPSRRNVGSGEQGQAEQALEKDFSGKKTFLATEMDS